MVKQFDIYNQGHDVTVALTVGTDAYTQYDVVGGLQTITKSLGTSWFGCVLRAVSIIDAGAQSNPFKLYIFKQLPSTIADDAAWATATIADLQKMPAGHNGINFQTANYETYTTGDEGTVTIATKADLNIGLDLRGGTPSTFYAYLVDQDTFDAVAADDVTIVYHFWID